MPTTSEEYEIYGFYQLNTNEVYLYVPPAEGGRPQTKTYKKTKRIYTGRDKIKRIVYIKNEKFYVKRKDAKTGKFKYVNVKM